MKILLDGYFDRNLGDDLMLTLAARGLKEHEIYVPPHEINIGNARYTQAKSGFDAYLKVTGSGFVIYNTLGAAYRLRDAYREAKYAPRRAVISCNIGPFANAIGEAAVKKHLSQFDFVTVRDTRSLEYMNRHFPEKNAVCRPDIVFSLPDDMIPDVKSENLLGIAVRGAADCDALAEIADRYIAETGGKTLILCFDSGMENDLLAAERVKETMRAGDKAEIIHYETINDMLYAMKRCAAVLCVRLHASVLAARMGIPFAAVSYSQKTEDALREAGVKSKIYKSGSLPVQEVTDALLNPTDFKVSADVVKAASEHIGKFKEYLEENIDKTI